MEADCFIINSVSILNYLNWNKDKYKSICKSIAKPEENTYIVYLKKPGYGHFVLSHNGQIWDSLNPERPSAKDYKIDSYRVIN
jgi:hypothetical protein